MSERDIEKDVVAAEADADDDVAAEEPQDNEPPAQKQGGGQSGLVRILVIVIVFLAGAALWPVIGPALAPYIGQESATGGPTAADLQGLSGRIDGLEARLASTETSQQVLSRTAREQANATAALDERLQAAAVDTPNDLAPQLAALVARIEALEAREPEALSVDVTGLTDRFSKLEGAASEAQSTLDEMQAVLEESRRAAEEGRDATVRATETIAATQNALGGLERRIAALEAAQAKSGNGGQRQALVLAVGQLGQKITAGQPYAAELARLTSFAGDDAQIGSATDALQSSAKGGVATLAELKRRFQSLAGDIVQAGAAPKSDDWLDATSRKIMGLVTIRRTGDVEGDDVDAIVARAEARLAAGDLGSAVQELSALQGAAAETAGPWRQAAAARLAVDGALAALQARAIELMGQS